MTNQYSKQGGQNSVDLNKPFWKYKIHFNSGDKRVFEEGIINEPISEKEARVMLFEHAGLKNSPQIIYLENL